MKPGFDFTLPLIVSFGFWVGVFADFLVEWKRPKGCCWRVDSCLLFKWKFRQISPKKWTHKSQWRKKNSTKKAIKCKNSFKGSQIKDKWKKEKERVKLKIKHYSILRDFCSFSSFSSCSCGPRSAVFWSAWFKQSDNNQEKRQEVDSLGSRWQRFISVKWKNLTKHEPVFMLVFKER